LIAIGIAAAAQSERGTSLHSFRHFINTQLRSKVADHLVRATVGHVDEKMTDHYTDHDTETLAPVADALRTVFTEAQNG
jgi:integrase